MPHTDEDSPESLSGTPMLADDRTIGAITSMVLALQDQESSALPMYEQQLQEANTSINNLLNAIQQGILTKSTKNRLEELEAARDELENKIALEKLAKPRVSEEQVRFFLHRFRALDIAKPEQRKTLIDVFLNAVYVINDKIVISCNYKDGTKTINFSDMECALTQCASVPGSDLDCPGAPRQNNTIRSPAAARRRPVDRWCCLFFLSKPEDSRGRPICQGEIYPMSRFFYLAHGINLFSGS